MDLWSISFVIENQFKNLFSEYVEDFEGYLSSSLFNNTKNVLPINIVNNLGEFHQNEFWTLEVLVQKKPDNNLVEMKLNNLARQLSVNEYYTDYITREKKINAKKVSIKKIIQKNWLNINRQSFPVINIERFYIYGSHIRKNYSKTTPSIYEALVSLLHSSISSILPTCLVCEGKWQFPVG